MDCRGWILKTWTLKDEFSFKVHIYKADYSEGYDVVKTLKLLFFDEVVVKEGVWIDVWINARQVYLELSLALHDEHLRHA